MAEEGFKRKLTSILSADVEGYSRLMGEGRSHCAHAKRVNIDAIGMVVLTSYLVMVLN